MEADLEIAIKILDIKEKVKIFAFTKANNIRLV